MSSKIVDVVLSLRQRLIDAGTNKDQEVISKLLTTFGMLVETSYERKLPDVTGLFTSLEDAARDALMGVSWKAAIPSVQDIEKILD